MPQWLRRFPIVIAMALLLAPWAVAGLNHWGGALIIEHQLAGVAPAPARPVFTLHGLWTGRDQAAFTAYFDRNLPLLASAVGLKNQLYYSLLHQSGSPTVVLGQYGQLFEPAYIDEYCTRQTASLQQAGETWARDLAQMQAWYAARGKLFVYVVTPSKAATYPQYIPGFYACRSPPAERDSLMSGWNALLDRHGVRHVDATALIQQAKPDYPFELFPRGGTHWNEVAAALATQALVRIIDAAPTPWKLPDFSFTWQMIRPSGVASDLTDLLNLPFPRLDYRVPMIAVTAPSPPVCQPPTIGVVGGSFTFEILWILEKLPCPPKIDFYAYWHTIYAHYPGDIRHDVVAAQRDAALLDRADIVVLEENEQVAFRSDHGPAFYDLVAGRR